MRRQLRCTPIGNRSCRRRRLNSLTTKPAAETAAMCEPLNVNYFKHLFWVGTIVKATPGASKGAEGGKLTRRAHQQRAIFKNLTGLKLKSK